MADPVFVETTDTAKAAITGANTSDGTGAGVVGRSTKGAGVVGLSDNGEGVHGESSSTNSAAITGTNRGSGNGAGVVGISGEGGTGAGVVGISHNGRGAAIFGQGRIAGQFNGDVAVEGALRIKGTDVLENITKALTLLQDAVNAVQAERSGAKSKDDTSDTLATVGKGLAEVVPLLVALF
jgi:hypothetical protein